MSQKISLLSDLLDLYSDAIIQVQTLVEVVAKFYRHLQKMPANFFYKTWKIQGPCMETFCRITMQLSLFELKLKPFPLLHHRDHFVFTRKFLK